VIWVLNDADWKWFTPDSVYGMPHYSQRSLYLAGGRADFWKGLAEEIAQRATPDLQKRFTATYGAGGEPDLTPFFDLLAVHELAHAYQDPAPSSFPRHWLAELFANLCLHAYVVTKEPGQLQVLETFPAVYATLDGFDYLTLAQFEAVYSAMDPRNYAWYQSRFHRAAARIYEARGTEALRSLWRMCSHGDELLGRHLEADVDEEVAGVLRAWPK
jgi:hypothetical protein